MKIAICDDDYGICEELSKWLRKADNDSRKQMIEVFQEAEKLLTSIQNGAVYDLLYLDVELPDINGVEVGARLKDMEILYLCQERILTARICLTFDHLTFIKNR